MTLTVFLLCMLLHPEVQEKAQAQLDSVIGSDRLPEFDDKTSLPYIEAIVLESLRWHPVAPLAAPHRSTTDDEYNGYHIAAGTIVIPSIWYALSLPSYRSWDVQAH